MVKAKKFVMAKTFDGEPKPSDFQLIEEELPSLHEGEFLAETLWLSVDPYMRLYAQNVSFDGKAMPGGVVALIVESKAPEYPKGKYVVHYLGWRSKAIYNTREEWKEVFPKPYILPDFQGLSLSLGVGALGMPGITANLGFLGICKPQPGETVVVNAAAGAVGSLVGQIAKIKGCRVIGFAGSEEKVKWLTQKLGFDAAYNYKKVKIADALAEAAPNGVDCYFDNVGGTFSHAVRALMNTNGRITVCGAIEGYNVGLEKVLVPMPEPHILLKELKVEGFVIWSHPIEEWLEAIKQNIRWIKENKLICEETITEGFENAPRAFMGMLKGENTGKAVVKI